MKRNPLIPFALIAATGLLVMLILSYQGLDKSDRLANPDKYADASKVTPEEIVQKSCISCHGADLKGGAGPDISNVGSRLSEDQIKEVLKNGKGTMPGGLVKPATNVDKVAKWLSEQK
ncbi:cytochrome c550 [Priestia taiwanensis]|uniref:Cytochrome c n=1 Tax=Priestia taiwanensis TaxID=1347902 RepID=A0A917EQ80_9BACI|nr:cytochrome c [Priestia taiwanensis]MBM7363763.1 cytochrome c550 [Priestia taiwanensis]GGE74356.1 cytochrome c [Priestia taiwanensis]